MVIKISHHIILYLKENIDSMQSKSENFQIFVSCDPNFAKHYISHTVDFRVSKI
jgi:hypothetical protein